MKISIIIPVYNEEKTIAKLLQRVAKITLPGSEKEMIVVDDGSTDETRSQIESQKSTIAMRVFSHKHNQGKGAAVRTGIAKARGEYIIIQDADLEYDPRQIPLLLKPIQQGEALVVYGTRLKRLPHFRTDERTPQFLLHYLGNKLLSLVTSLLYFQWITDMETCYKVFPRKAALDMHLVARGFEFEPEITAKLLKKGYLIKEVPIITQPRGYDEGKKLDTLKDGALALWTLIKYRFVD